MILRAAGASGAAEFGKSFNGHCLCLQLGGCVLVQGQKTIRFIELFLHFSHGTQDMVSAPAAGTTGQCGNISWGTAPVCKHIYILFILLTFHESSLSLSPHFLLPPLDQFLLTNDALILTTRYSRYTLYLTTDLKCWDDWSQAHKHKHNQHCCVQHCTLAVEGETCINNAESRHY